MSAIANPGWDVPGSGSPARPRRRLVQKLHIDQAPETNRRMLAVVASLRLERGSKSG